MSSLCEPFEVTTDLAIQFVLIQYSSCQLRFPILSFHVGIEDTITDIT